MSVKISLGISMEQRANLCGTWLILKTTATAISRGETRSHNSIRPLQLPSPTRFSVFNVGKTVLCVPVEGGGGGGEPFKK